MPSPPRSDAWLTEPRVRRLARALVLLQALLLAFIVAGSHGWLTSGVGPSTTDYASFYAAGRLANQGTPALAYNEAAHRRTEEALRGQGIAYEYFFYPPTFLLLCAPLARLPYLASFLLFQAITFAAWLGLTLRIAGGGAAARWSLLACGPVWWVLGLGQNGFLSAAILAGGTLLLPRRPALAGALLGCLCFKPHFGLILPFAFLAGRQWRAFAGAAATLAAAILAPLVLFGRDTWRTFLAHEQNATATLYSAKIHLAGHVELSGAAILAGIPAAAATWFGAAAMLAAILATILVWRRPASEPRAAALAAGALAAAPFALFYDLGLATVAGAWIARLGRQRGFLPWEKTGLAAAVLASIAAYPLATLTHVQLGALIAPGLLALALRAAYRT